MPVASFLNLLLGVIVLATPALSQPTTGAVPAAIPAANAIAWPSLGPPNFLAHGSDSQFWIARVELVPRTSPAVEQTVIYVRPGGQATWRRSAALPARVVDIGNRGGQLALLLDNGDWMASSDESATLGAALPDRAQMLAVTGGDDTFWALGRATTAAAAVSIAPSSEPATRSSTRPATTRAVGAAPDAPRIKLFMLDSGKWTVRSELPADVGLAASARLCVIGRTPCAAILETTRRVRAIPFATEDGHWLEGPVLRTASDIVAFKFLGGAPTPVLWVAQADGASSLYFLRDAQPPRRVDLSVAGAGGAQTQTVAFAAGRIHLLSPADGKNAGKLIDQNLDVETGLRSGPASLVPLGPSSAYPDITQPTQFVIWAALAFAIVSSLRWRRLMQGRVFDLDKLHLAPLGVRLGAGLIDVLPALTPLLILLRHPEATPRQALELLEFAAAPLYLLHTTAIEAAFGRSLGKMCLGLRVVSIDGTRPSISSLLIRNLLRIIDIGLVFLPLAVILFSPLRQRTGDVAAGTLVVRPPAGAEVTDSSSDDGGARPPEPPGQAKSSKTD